MAEKAIICYVDSCLEPANGVDGKCYFHSEEEVSGAHIFLGKFESSKSLPPIPPGALSFTGWCKLQGFLPEELSDLAIWDKAVGQYTSYLENVN